MNAVQRVARVAAVSALALGTVTLPAFAQASKGERTLAISGLVTLVNSGSVQLQTRTGSTTVLFTKSTRVARLVTGSLADLTPDARVFLRLARGSRIVESVRVEERPAVVEHHATGLHRPTEHTGVASRPIPRTLKFINPAGQVVSVRGNDLLLRYPNGSTASFTLSDDVTVTKMLSGTLNDLEVGESVEVFAGRTGGAAALIIIVNA